MKGFVVNFTWPYLDDVQKAVEDHLDLDWLCSGSGATDAGMEIIMPGKKEMTKDEIQDFIWEVNGGSWLEVFGPYELCDCGDFLVDIPGDCCQECKDSEALLEQLKLKENSYGA